METKVFLVVVNWNNYEDSVECLKSLQSQEQSAEIILVDNGSSENVENRLKKEFPEVTHLKNERNEGFAGGSNPGIKYALKNGADYIGLLNNDTVVTEPFIEKLIAVIESKGSVAGASPVIYRYPQTGEIWGAGGRFRKLIGRPEQFTQLQDEKPYKVDYLSGCCALFKSDVFKKVSLLDEDYFFYYEDVDLALKLKEKGLDLYVVPEARIFHKVSETSGGQYTYFSTYHLLRSNQLLIKKNYPGSAKILPYLYLLLLSIKVSINPFLYSLKNKRQILSAVTSAWKDFLVL